MRKHVLARRDDAPDRRPAISTKIAVQDSADPAVGVALVEQLRRSIGDGELLTAEHRHLAASLRRNLEAQARLAGETSRSIVPRNEVAMRGWVETLRGIASRAGDIEDAVSHALVLGGLLGDLERAIILRMLASIRGAVIRVRAGIIDVTMSADWDDIGGEG